MLYNSSTSRNYRDVHLPTLLKLKVQKQRLVHKTRWKIHRPKYHMFGTRITILGAGVYMTFIMPWQEN